LFFNFKLKYLNQKIKIYLDSRIIQVFRTILIYAGTPLVQILQGLLRLTESPQALTESPRLTLYGNQNYMTTKINKKFCLRKLQIYNFNFFKKKMQLPQIDLVDSSLKLNQIIFDADHASRNDKVLAYLNQVGLINYNEKKMCENGHPMLLKRNKRADGWWWRCAPKGCQKAESVRNGTFFHEGKIALWEVLLLIFDFAFEFLNTTTRQILGFSVSVQTISLYKKRLRLIILRMFDKKNAIIGGEGRIVEIDRKSFH
jgi:hypothetical protein